MPAKKTILISLLMVVLSVFVRVGQALAIDESPADVASILNIAMQEIEFIRLQKGKERPNPLIFKISNVVPREMYYQALTLYHKSDRLCFDHTGDVGPLPPKAKTDAINYQDIYKVMKGALERIRCLRASLDITDLPKQVSLGRSSDPSEIYKEILLSNRQINILLDNPYVPSTVYMRVQLALEYGKSLLKIRYPNVPVPTKPSFREKKRPVDVYEQLLKCFLIVKGINLYLGEEIINLKVEDIGPYIVPGDVFDLASLLVAEVQFIRQRLLEKDLIKPLDPIAYPGRKAPSHVLQNGKHLEAVLKAIHIELDREQ